MRGDDLRLAFGRRVRELRTAARMSQEELAERARLHRNYIGGVKRGERNIALLNIGRLSLALGVTISELFQGIHVRPRR